MIADTAAPPCAGGLERGQQGGDRLGIRVSLTTILVTMPSVPSEPVNAPTRS